MQKPKPRGREKILIFLREEDVPLDKLKNVIKPRQNAEYHIRCLMADKKIIPYIKLDLEQRKKKKIVGVLPSSSEVWFTLPQKDRGFSIIERLKKHDEGARKDFMNMWMKAPHRNLIIMGVMKMADSEYDIALTGKKLIDLISLGMVPDNLLMKLIWEISENQEEGFNEAVDEISDYVLKTYRISIEEGEGKKILEVDVVDKVD